MMIFTSHSVIHKLRADAVIKRLETQKTTSAFCAETLIEYSLIVRAKPVKYIQYPIKKKSFKISIVRISLHFILIATESTLKQTHIFNFPKHLQQKHYFGERQLLFSLFTFLPHKSNHLN